jgi:hypothetical protein
MPGIGGGCALHRCIFTFFVLGIAATHAALADPVVVSCYRGPWKVVIWDHSNAEFIDSLMANGYGVATASAIADKVCRDERLVGDPDAMKAETERLIRLTPRR